MKKVKAVEIARALGISKATVSLALNGKPGVSEQTIQAIQDCKERLERGEVIAPKTEEKQEERVIKIIFATKGFTSSYKGEIDLSTDTLATFIEVAKRHGYTVSIDIGRLDELSLPEVVRSCDAASVKGVVLFATDLSEEELNAFEQIRKPMVVYDNISPEHRHSSVVADNYHGVKRAVKYLIALGHQDVVYLAHRDDMYNFSRRKKGYRAALRENHIPEEMGKIVTLGSHIDEIGENMKLWLEQNSLPSAFFMENYQVSIGAVRALQEQGVKIPEEVSLIGVDTIPSYLTGGVKLTTVLIPHTRRAYLTMMLLIDEIEQHQQDQPKSILYLDCPLQEGSSVRTLESKK